MNDAIFVLAYLLAAVWLPAVVLAALLEAGHGWSRARRLAAIRAARRARA